MLLTPVTVFGLKCSQEDIDGVSTWERALVVVTMKRETW